MRIHDDTCVDCKEGGDSDVDRDISMNEVEEVVRNLVDKSPGIDGIGNECIKKAGHITIPLLCELFNKVLETGIFPESWCTAIIVPIHKSGSVNNPNNYRGIALLSCISKIFTKIINKRLITWANINNKMFEEQGGFTRGKSTTDQIFILQALISKYLSRKGGRCYNVFVDFSKAFDTVPHLNLFYKLISEGLHGRVVCLLRNMYMNLKSCVQLESKCITRSFDCRVGTRQGCMLSPFFFIFYLNEYIRMCKDKQCKGIYVSEEYKDVTMLLYADDLVLIGDQVGNVQNLLNILSDFCSKWGLKVNMDKTKMLVYRNGGIVKQNEKCFINGVKIESVSYYKYLGVLFSTRLSWTPAQETLSAQGKKAMYFIDTMNYSCDFSYKTSCQLFYKCIIPVITYGCEIWGYDVHRCTENVLYTFCRKQLGVGSKTPIPAVLAECGQWPLFIACQVKLLKYWLKIISFQENSILQATYQLMYQLCNSGRINWATNVKTLLYKYGFGYIWEEQYVYDSEMFLKQFRRRLEDCYFQTWNSNRREMPKLRLYNQYKIYYEAEEYLFCNIPRIFRQCLAKFRTCNSSLEIEIGRHTSETVENRICKLCNENNIVCVEDEYHVLMKCPSYNDIRNIYIGSGDNMHHFLKIMSNKCESVQIRLACFVYYMFKIRTLKLAQISR